MNNYSYSCTCGKVFTTQAVDADEGSQKLVEDVHFHLAKEHPQEPFLKDQELYNHVRAGIQKTEVPTL